MNAIRLRESIACFPEGAGAGARFTEAEDGKTVSFQNVAVLGLESANTGSDGKSRRYNKESSIAAIPMYEGSQVGLDHAGMFEGPSVDRLAGKIVGVKWDEGRGKLMADQLIVQRTPMTEHALHMMMAQPEHLGLSHDVSAKEREHGEGDDAHLELHISKVWSVDVVRHPATNSNLFESHGQLQFRVSEDEAELVDHGSGERRTWRVQDGDRIFTVLEGGEDPPSTNPTMTKKEPEGTVEERLAALEAKLGSAESALEAEKKRADEAEAKLAKQAVEARVAESELPEKAKEKILRASEGKSLDEVDSMIAAEAAYLKDLGIEAQETDDGDDGEPNGKPRKKTERGVKGVGPDSPPAPAKPDGEDNTVENEFRGLVGSTIGLMGDDLDDFVGIEKKED